MTVVRINQGRAHYEQPRSDAKRTTRCGLAIRPDLDYVTELATVDHIPPNNRCRKCYPGTGRP